MVDDVKKTNSDSETESSEEGELQVELSNLTLLVE